MNQSGPDMRVVELIMALRSAGIVDKTVLSALERVPREAFVTPEFTRRAYENRALPIACGQTISQPFVVALMTEALCLTPRLRVLEVGTGSGYQSAVLSKLVRRVYTIERYRTLLKTAEARFERLRLRNIVTRLGDGMLGWPEQGEFDRILVTAGTEVCPPALLSQLCEDGLLVAPIGPPDGQFVTVFRRDGDHFHQRQVAPVRFVPLISGIASAL
jgi:protein-L-isoaspartate(D-aspartate) O-methyltransferase